MVQFRYYVPYIKGERERLGRLGRETTPDKPEKPDNLGKVDRGIASVLQAEASRREYRSACSRYASAKWSQCNGRGRLGV